jgi:hypothetical protein
MRVKIFRDELLRFSQWVQELVAITVETLIAEAEAARSKAMREKGGANAAVAASLPRQSSRVCGVKRWRRPIRPARTRHAI